MTPPPPSSSSGGAGSTGGSGSPSPAGGGPSKGKETYLGAFKELMAESLQSLRNVFRRKKNPYKHKPTKKDHLKSVGKIIMTGMVLFLLYETYQVLKPGSATYKFLFDRFKKHQTLPRPVDTGIQPQNKLIMFLNDQKQSVVAPANPSNTVPLALAQKHVTKA